MYAQLKRGRRVQEADIVLHIFVGQGNVALMSGEVSGAAPLEVHGEVSCEVSVKSLLKIPVGHNPENSTLLFTALFGKVFHPRLGTNTQPARAYCVGGSVARLGMRGPRVARRAVLGLTAQLFGFRVWSIRAARAQPRGFFLDTLEVAGRGGEAEAVSGGTHHALHGRSGGDTCG